MEEKDTIKAGDVVRLKSGGPEMTVYGWANDVGVTCQWFPYIDGAYPEVKHGKFSEASLVRVDENQSSGLPISGGGTTRGNHY